MSEKEYLLTTYESGWNSYGYYFRTPGDISCSMGTSSSSSHDPFCKGVIPAIGGMGGEGRSITTNGEGVPLPSMPADLNSWDSPHVYLPGNSYNNVKLLPAGYKFHLDKADPDSSFLGSTCVVPDKDSLGCINTANHGFLFTRDSTTVF